MSDKEKKVLVGLIILFILLAVGFIRSPLELPFLIFYGFVGIWSKTGKPLWQAALACYGITSLGIIMLYLGTSWLQSIFLKIRHYFGLEDIRSRKPIAKVKADIQSLLENRDGFSVPLLYLHAILVALKGLGLFLLTPIVYWIWLATIFLKKQFPRSKGWFYELWRKVWKKKSAEKKNNEKNHRFARGLAKHSLWLILLVLFAPFPYTDPAATIAMKLKGVKHGLWYLLAVNLPHIFLFVWLLYQGIKLWPW